MEADGCREPQNRHQPKNQDTHLDCSSVSSIGATSRIYLQNKRGYSYLHGLAHTQGSEALNREQLQRKALHIFSFLFPSFPFLVTEGWSLNEEEQRYYVTCRDRNKEFC
ncbi:hypothetical protein AVEN_182475-1 [Araneus ventricosus]|uniref:Uncharacterized protein n=1 Tax=Araneus ventricosus TaxID=182803 RepID=A0A4Y2K1Q3_ARAVE|nr:hypothetical protein AVEN_182475-1 [Araneus ventricosus]